MDNINAKQAVIFLHGRRSGGGGDALRQDEGVLRQRLNEAGIAHADAVVIEDAAPGLSGRRAAHLKLTSMLAEDRVAALAMRDLSRLARRRGDMWRLIGSLSLRGVPLVLADGLVSREQLLLLAAAHSLLSEFYMKRVQRHRRTYRRGGTVGGSRKEVGGPKR